MNNVVYSILLSVKSDSDKTINPSVKYRFSIY